MSEMTELRDYVGFTDDDTQRLRALWPELRTHVDDMIDRFYAAALRFPRSAAVFRDQGQVERLKGSLAHWIEELCAGPHDDDYYARRLNIGRVHVRVGLLPQYMFTAMNLLREDLLDAARAAAKDEATARATTTSILRICDIELAIMLGTYMEAREEGRARREEPLKHLGTLAATVAHEFRNPLAGMSATIQVVQASMPDDERRRALNKVQDHIARLGSLIGDLLSFARPVVVDTRAVDLHVVARAAAETPTATAEVIGTGRALAEPQLLQQAIGNLVQNAFQAGATRVHVQIDGCIVRVVDDGPGIAPDVRERLFEPFFTTKTRGTGLGLPIAKKMVEAMHGTLVVCDSPLGGAGFQISLTT